jgi:hypothetical protein
MIERLGRPGACVGEGTVMTKRPRGRVTICAGNRLAKEPGWVTQITALGYQVKTEDCLDQCTRCGCCAIALVNGTRWVHAPTPEALLAKLR